MDLCYTEHADIVREQQGELPLDMNDFGSKRRRNDDITKQ